MKSVTKFEVNYNGTKFLMDVADGNLMSLNEIYAAAGSPANKDAPTWLRTADVAEFLMVISAEKSTSFKHLAEGHLKSRPEPKEKSKELVEWCREAYAIAVKCGIVVSKKGKYGGGTWAYWKVATKYAYYLSPALESAILDVFQERVQEEINPELGLKRGRERAIASWRRQGKNEDWIEQRCLQIDNWHGFTDTLKAHGVNGEGYGRCADSLNVPILGGTSKEIKKSRSIATKSLRDGLDEVENAAINFAQVLAKKKIKTENINGNRLCAIACFKSAEKVASVL